MHDFLLHMLPGAGASASQHEVMRCTPHRCCCSTALSAFTGAPTSARANSSGVNDIFVQLNATSAEGSRGLREQMDQEISEKAGAVPYRYKCILQKQLHLLVTNAGREAARRLLPFMPDARWHCSLLGRVAHRCWCFVWYRCHADLVAFRSVQISTG